MRSIGPQMRMLWCKLKWEEGEAKRAGTPEERAVERGRSSCSRKPRRRTRSIPRKIRT